MSLRFLPAFLIVAVAGFAPVALPQPPKDTAQPKEKAQPKQPALPDGVTAERNLAYGPHERHKLDVYRPKSEKPLPLVIWVHGGGWEGGSKDSGGPALFLLQHGGFAVASINYRLSSHAKFPAQIEDVRAAVRFLRANAKKYNLDPDAFGAWGSSAGGHLVALLGTSSDVKGLDGDAKNTDVSCRVSAVCDFFGPTDLVRLTTPGGENAVTRLLGGNPRDKPELAKLANPITHVTKDDPPVLILHGDEDKLVPLSQSELFVEALKKADVGCELIVLKGAGHGGAGFASPENRKAITGFFDKHLKKK